jgi:hypothetical protein
LDGIFGKNNVHVGKEKKGYEMELDIIAYNPHPHKEHLIHIEVSLGVFSWEERGKDIGKKYIFSEIFTWLDDSKDIDQLIISTNKTKNGLLNGIKIITVDDFMMNITSVQNRIRSN